MKPEKIQLFSTCLVNEFYPETGLAAAHILERLNINVDVPSGQICCGQPAFNAGYYKEAKKIAQHTVEMLAKTEGPVIIPSGSCTYMITRNYPGFFRDDPYFLNTVSPVIDRCFEFTQFLVEVLGVQKTGARSTVKAAYHPSCHLTRGLGIKEPPVLLLENIDGLTLEKFEDQDECCGFGGIFSVRYPEISGALMDKKIALIEASGADIIIGCDTGCLMHLEGGLRRKNSRITCRHIAQFLSEGTG
ncbi:(Fe-S)-binding protein [candidate division KSB1 bacterium]